MASRQNNTLNTSIIMDYENIVNTLLPKDLSDEAKIKRYESLARALIKCKKTNADELIQRISMMEIVRIVNEIESNNSNNFIRDELVSANRYEDIKTILDDLIGETEIKYQISASKVYDEYTSCLDGYDLRYEAGLLKSLIMSDSFSLDMFDRMERLRAYTVSHLNVIVLNHCVDIAYRNTPIEESVENIRCWLIIRDLLNTMCKCSEYYYEDRVEEWTIPEGWKRKY